MINKKFIDYYSNSKYQRPWQEKKAANETYANLLMNGEIHGYSLNAISNIDACANKMRFIVNKSGEKRLYQTFFCHDRLCPICRWRLYIKRSTELNELLRRIHSKNPASKILFLTLTIPSVTGNELNQTIKRINQGVSMLMRYAKVKKNIIAYVKRIEVTIHTKTKKDVLLSEEPQLDKNVFIKYHPHIHLLLVEKSTFFKNKANYINNKEWQILWQRAIKWGTKKNDTNQPLDCFCEQIKSQKDDFNSSSFESAKYITKKRAYLNDEKDYVIRTFIDKTIIETLHSQLLHLRMYGYGGAFKKMYKEMGYDKNNYLKNSTNNSKKEKVFDYIVVTWNAKSKNYFISDEGKISNQEIEKQYQKHEYNNYQKVKLIYEDHEKHHNALKK